MKAIEIAEYGEPEVLELVEKAKPKYGPDEVRIAVNNVGINFADIEKRKGQYPNSPEPPYIPGIEIAGKIESIGDDVDRTMGDEVTAIVEKGGYAEFVTVEEENILEIPEGVDVSEASAYPVHFLTAHNALHEWGDVKKEEKLLIHAAAGGVGSAAVQLASNAQVEIFATASTDEKLRFAEEIGADHTINYEEEDVNSYILDHTAEDGVDLVLDGVGGDAFYTALDVLADSGRIVTYGIASGNVPVLSPPRLIFENKSIIGYHLGHALEHERPRVKKSLPSLHGKFGNKDIKINIGKKFPLQDADRAHAYLENRKSIGKVILEI